MQRVDLLKLHLESKIWKEFKNNGLNNFDYLYHIGESLKNINMLSFVE